MTNFHREKIVPFLLNTGTLCLLDPFLFSSSPSPPLFLYHPFSFFFPQVSSINPNSMTYTLKDGRQAGSTVFVQ